MAYFDQDMKKIVANEINPILKKYGVKATLSVKHYSSVCLNIKSGRLDLIGNNEEKYKVLYFEDKSNGFSGECEQFLNEAITALRSAGYYDNSDYTTDFFNVAYYYSINVGHWQKPYILTN